MVLTLEAIVELFIFSLIAPPVGGASVMFFRGRGAVKNGRQSG